MRARCGLRVPRLLPPESGALSTLLPGRKVRIFSRKSRFQDSAPAAPDTAVLAASAVVGEDSPDSGSGELTSGKEGAGPRALLGVMMRVGVVRKLRAPVGDSITPPPPSRAVGSMWETFEADFCLQASQYRRELLLSYHQ